MCLLHSYPSTVAALILTLSMVEWQPIWAQDKQVSVRKVDVAISLSEVAGCLPDIPVHKSVYVVIPITDTEGLADVISDDTTRKALAKQVDFSAEKLLLIRWPSSKASPQLRAEVLKGKGEILFEIVHQEVNPLLLPAVHPRIEVYAVSRGVKWSLKR